MAIRGQEIELLGDGIKADSPTKGAFALNMLYRRNAWEVRRGFGQVTELDTTMRAGQRGGAGSWPETTRWGYIEHMGSYGMTTSFGHEQIISVFTANVWTGDRRRTASLRTQELSAWLPIYVVDIYDVTTGDRWEEPIFRHTSEYGNSETSLLEMPDWRGTYETWWRTDVAAHNTGGLTLFGAQAPGSFNEDQQQWVTVNEPAQQFFFHELDDVLYMGNDDTGLLAYMPSVFRGRRRSKNGLSRLGRDKQANTVNDRSWAQPYSESSVLINAVASDGPFSDGFVYLSQAGFPKPTCVTSTGNRLILAQGRKVYFSDSLFPTSIAAPNEMTLPSEENITAMTEHNGNIIIFTATETWYYQVPTGFVAIGGRLVRIAEGIGCISTSTVTKDTILVWMDRRGVYTLGGDLTPQKISAPIEPFFNDYISNPVTDYFVDNGHVPNPVPDQSPISVRRLGKPAVVYSRELECVLFSVPDKNAVLCFSANKWSIWSTETMVTGGDPAVVGSSVNIERPWLVTFDSGLYMVGSLPPDAASPGNGQQLDTSTISRSYYILEYGRGGGVDRSVEAVEDYRLVRGRWRSHNEDSTAITPAHSDHYLYVGKPIPIPQGMGIGDLSTANVSLTTDAVDGAVWIPIGLVLGYRDDNDQFVLGDHPGRLGPPGAGINLVLSYDNANWAPIPTRTVSTDVQFFLPPERLPSRQAWTVTDATPNITVTFDPTLAPAASWTHYPQLALQHRQLNRLVYLPFKPTTTATTLGPMLTPVTAELEQGGRAGATAIRCFVWDQTNLLAERHEDNDVAQAVDWAYKSAPVKAEGSVQIKGRGLYMDVLSHGTATPTHRLHEDWPFGLLNILSAPDTKGWSSQVVDVSPPSLNPPPPSSVTNIANKNTIRTRYAQNSSTALTTNTFNNNPTGPRYGTPGGMSVLNDELVADEEVSQLAVSDSVRGESFTYMVWGSIQNKAERIAVESVRAVMRVLGGKKRRGR